MLVNSNMNKLMPRNILIIMKCYVFCRHSFPSDFISWKTILDVFTYRCVNTIFFKRYIQFHTNKKSSDKQNNVPNILKI